MNSGTKEEFESIIQEAGTIALKRGYDVIKRRRHYCRSF